VANQNSAGLNKNLRGEEASVNAVRPDFQAPKKTEPPIPSPEHAAREENDRTTRPQKEFKPEKSGDVSVIRVIRPFAKG